MSRWLKPQITIIICILDNVCSAHTKRFPVPLYNRLDYSLTFPQCYRFFSIHCVYLNFHGFLRMCICFFTFRLSLPSDITDVSFEQGIIFFQCILMLHYQVLETTKGGYSPFYPIISDLHCLLLILYLLACYRDSQAQCYAILHSLRCKWVYYEQMIPGSNNLGNTIYYNPVLGILKLNSI